MRASLAVLAVVLQAGLAVEARAQAYPVEIAVPEAPRMTPAQVEAVAFPLGLKPPAIIGMKCVPGSAIGVHSFPQGRPEETYTPARVWIVQWPGAFVMVDDANGEIWMNGTGKTAIGPAPSK
jgi:hypothetical protein